MKTLLLDVEPACDFALLGLVSTAPGYRVAWWVNQVLGVRLVRRPDYRLDEGARGRLVIARYAFTGLYGRLRLLRNRSLEPSTLPRPFLSPELERFDYLLQFEGAWADRDPEPWLVRLRQIPLVQYVSRFDPTQLRSQSCFWELGEG